MEKLVIELVVVAVVVVAVFEFVSERGMIVHQVEVEVGVQFPLPESGLRILPEIESGMVQKEVGERLEEG